MTIIFLKYLELTNDDPLLKRIINFKPETFSSFSQEKNLESSCTFSPLIVKEYQYILKLLKQGNIRVGLGSALDYEVAQNYPAEQ